MPTSLMTRVNSLLDSMEELPYLGEKVSQRNHALQCGRQLLSQQYDDEMVIAGILHDVGRVPGIAVKGQPHEVSGAAWARTYFGDRIAWLIGQHVIAKRVLVARDSQYASSLSRASISSLRRQGGLASEEEVVELECHEWSDDALALRRADEAAKDPQGLGLDLNEVASLLEGFEKKLKA